MNHKVLNLLNRCHTLKDLKSLHSRLVIEGSVNSSDILLNKVLRFYFRYGEINYAHKLFDQVPEPNAFLWTSMIHGYVENKKYGESFGMFRCMLGLSIPPLNFTVMSVLKALARSGGLKEGEAVYGFVRKCGFGFDVMVQNAVIDLFMRCGEVDLARLVFDEMSEKDVVTWNSMISGYGNNGRVDVAHLDAAVNLLEAMPMHEVTTWNIILLGFCKAHDLKSAKSYFGKMRCKNVASWTMMVDGYVKLGDLNEARLVFEEMPEKNLIAWSTMIAGYAKNGQPQRALELFVQFKEQGIKPDAMKGVLSGVNI
uniref:Pentatricopeptide repeat-containing protein n=1 Tax=Daucus carota subsp. sativus TaxID=79200 RepID=A0A175YJW4_DAUCS